MRVSCAPVRVRAGCVLVLLTKKFWAPGSVRVRAACVLVLLTKKFWAPGSVRALESLDVARYEPRTVPRYSGY